MRLLATFIVLITLVFIGLQMMMFSFPEIVPTSFLLYKQDELSSFDATLAILDVQHDLSLPLFSGGWSYRQNNVVMSPDSNHLAYWDSNGSLVWIEVMQMDEENGHHNIVAVIDNSDSDFTPPVWSPHIDDNYAHLAFATSMSSDPQKWQWDIWIQDIPITLWTPETWTVDPLAETPPSVTNLGGTRHRLTYDEFDEIDLSWSPDGTQIAFSSDPDANSEIYTVDVESGDIQQLTDSSAIERYPTWSPDGEWIAFTSDRDGSVDVYKTNVDIGEVYRLTANQAEERNLSWSPNGAYIGYLVDYTLYVMRPDGSDNRCLLDAQEFSWMP